VGYRLFTLPYKQCKEDYCPEPYFCVSCSSFHFPLILCALFLPTSPEMFRNSFINFSISYEWCHKYWRIVNVRVYYPYIIPREFLIESNKYDVIASTTTITQDLPQCRNSASANVPLLRDEKAQYRK
jgi:hypothetical protein